METIMLERKETTDEFRLYKPRDQLKEGANICMHDLANLDCQSPRWHYSRQPAKMMNFAS